MKSRKNVIEAQRNHPGIAKYFSIIAAIIACPKATVALVIT